MVFMILFGLVNLTVVPDDLTGEAAGFLVDRVVVVAMVVS